MYHGNGCPIRCSYHIDLRINRRQSLFQYDHGKDTGSCRYITGSDPDTVGCCHAGSCISLRRTERNSRLQSAADIQKCCSLLCQYSSLFSCCQDTRQDLCQLPGKSTGCNEFIKLIHHFRIIGAGGAVNREHTGCITHTKHLFPCQLIMYIACQCGQKCDILYMCFLIQDRLIQMGNTPSLWNIKGEFLCQLLCRFLCNGISPGTERYQQLILCIKCQIAVHHG